MIYYFMIAITLTFQRTMAFVSLVITFLLMVSGMVISIGSILNKLPYGVVGEILAKSPSKLGNLIFWIEILFSALIVIVLYKVAKVNIHKGSGV